MIQKAFEAERVELMRFLITSRQTTMVLSKVVGDIAYETESMNPVERSEILSGVGWVLGKLCQEMEALHGRLGLWELESEG